MSDPDCIYIGCEWNGKERDLQTGLRNFGNRSGQFFKCHSRRANRHNPSLEMITEPVIGPPNLVKTVVPLTRSLELRSSPGSYLLRNISKMWATVYEELTFLSLNIVGWTIVAASFSCWRIVGRTHKVSNKRKAHRFNWMNVISRFIMSLSWLYA